MNKQTLLDLIEYNFWANERILTTCEQMTNDQFKSAITPDSGWKTFRGILVHALDAEFGWLCVLQASDDDAILEEEDFENVAILKARWSKEKAAWLAYFNGLTDEGLFGPADPSAENGKVVWQVIMHVMLHSMQHRSEAAIYLTGFGYSPGEIDFGVFMKERSAW